MFLRDLVLAQSNTSNYLFTAHQKGSVVIQSSINQYKQTHETEQTLENVMDEVLSYVDTGIFNMISGEYSRWAKTVRKEARFTHKLLCLIVHPVEIQTQLLTGRKDAFVLTYHIISLWFLEWGDRDRTVNDTTRNGLCHEVAFYPGTGEGTRHSVWCFGWKSARCIAVFSHVVPWRRPQNKHNFHSHVESKYHFPLLQTLKSKLSFGIADISVQSDANRQW